MLPKCVVAKCWFDLSLPTIYLAIYVHRRDALCVCARTHKTHAHATTAKSHKLAMNQKAKGNPRGCDAHVPLYNNPLLMVAWRGDRMLCEGRPPPGVPHFVAMQGSDCCRTAGNGGAQAGLG
jgi:hypothetical protein